ncbi:MAG: YqhA family protein, partial [Rhodospirillales bacterium]
MPKLEKMIEGAIFSSRWLQVPLYLGLILVLLVLCAKFFMVLFKLVVGMGEMDEAKIVLMVLELVDVVMVAN